MEEFEKDDDFQHGKLRHPSSSSMMRDDDVERDSDLQENSGLNLNPGNPGSANHPHNCKPCNKYNPLRPEGSCKHGKDCDFCHQQHDRPKHRGQRGRHALQRRQYIESRESLPEEFRRNVDKIYDVPHQALEQVKLRLQNNYPPREREARAHLVLEEIRDIGEQAHGARPDSTRLRGARISPADNTSSSLMELDGRCKWLVGTLHLMVRKLSDADTEPFKVDEIVDNILDKCRQLPEAVDGPLILGNPELKEWLNTQTNFLDGEDTKPLQQKLRDLAAKDLGRAQPQPTIEQFIGRIQTCDVLRSAWAWDKPEAAKQREALLEAQNLETLTKNIEKLATDYKEDLLERIGMGFNEADSEADDEFAGTTGSIETSRPNESLGRSWGPDKSGAGWSGSSSSSGLTRNQLVENVKRKFQQLDRRCEFLQEDLCRLVSQESDGGRPLNEINVLVDQIFHESKEIPKFIEKVAFIMDLDSDDKALDEKIRDKLLPSDSLSDLLTKLKAINKGKRG